MAKIFISAGHFNNDPGSTSARGTREANEMIQTRDLIVNELLIRGLTVGVDFFQFPTPSISAPQLVGLIHAL